jgi:hypothetical protein
MRAAARSQPNVSEREVELIGSALVAAHYQQHNAARLLGLTYDRFRGLYRNTVSS